MLDSRMLGNDDKEIDVDIEEKRKKARMLEEILRSTPSDSIDIEIPDEEELEEEKKRREEIANARAVRREAAAKKQQETRQSAIDAILAELTMEKAKSSSRVEEPDFDEILKEDEVDAVEEPDEEIAAPKRTRQTEEIIVPPALNAAEKAKSEEKERLARRAAAERKAERQYSQQSRSAKSCVKELKRSSEKTWEKNATEFQAKTAVPHAEHMGAVANVAVCLGILGVVALGMLVLERPTVSEIENRNLAKKPDFSIDAYKSGEYTAGLSEYYNDTVPFRSTFKNLTASIRQHMGVKGEDEIEFHGQMPTLEDQDDDFDLPTEPVDPTDIPLVTTDYNAAVTTDISNIVTDLSGVPGIVTNAAITDTAVPAVTSAAAETAAQTAATTASSESQKKTEKKEEDGELSNNILISKTRAISLFCGNDKHAIRYAGYLNSYAKQLPNVNIYSLVAPTNCSYYTPDSYKNRITSEEKFINTAKANMPSVKTVDTYNALLKHVDEPIYMRTDHHWGSLGAFYAAEEFAATARVPFAKLSDYDKDFRSGYVGTMYGYSGSKIIKDNPEDFFFYTPHAKYTTTYYDKNFKNGKTGSLLLNIDKMKTASWYLMFIGSDDRITHIETEVKNGRNLVVFKDSYGNALAPFLTSSFENVYICDIRYFTPNAIQFIKNVKATDVCFAMCSFSAAGGNSAKIEKIRTQ